MVEEVVAPQSKKARTFELNGSYASKPVRLSDIRQDREERITTGSGELDRVLGGGIVKGSLVLISGEPGIAHSDKNEGRPSLGRQKQPLYPSGDQYGQHNGPD